MTIQRFHDLPEKMTIGEAYKPAMEIQDETEAQAYLDALIRRAVKYHGQTEAEARKVELHNIGYFAGYYSDETAERVYRLFKTSHPIFGTSRPTAEEAFNAGKALAGKEPADAD